MIEFYKYQEKSELLDPTCDFKKTSQIIEHRKDPLLGTWCRINTDRAKRPHASSGAIVDVDKRIKEIVKKSDNCFFCAEKVMNKTPKHAFSESRIRKGKFILFPNLFPFAPYHGVGVLTDKHFLNLDKLGYKLWFDALTGSISWFKNVHKHDSAARFASFNFNYLMPAAASLVHPHVQPLVDKRADNGLDLLLKKSHEYYSSEKSNYWQDLLDNDSSRYIGKTGKRVYWHAAFSPRCNNEVIGIVCGKSSFLELSEEDIFGIADGISKVLLGLYAKGIRSVNMTINSAPIDETLGEFFYFNIRIVSRSLMVENYTTEQGFMEVLHNEPIISTIPEDVALGLRDYF
ncbi:MAG: hypothetical protein KAS12_04520 [Candidatus Aenigmarchaeota archaeon]|nr:hypothetical protein [Candidatus Aenigmarchaeota archaeon]